MSCVGNPAAIPAADHVNDRLFSTTLTRVVDPLLPRVPRTQARKDITSPNDDIWNSLTISCYRPFSPAWREYGECRQ